MSEENIPFWCSFGIHKWDCGHFATRDTINFSPVRIAGTGFDYEYTCQRCGKKVTKHEGGFF